MKEIVGENIRTRRDALGLSRVAVAQKIGIDPVMIYKWERGQHRPTDENLRAVAGVLGRDFAWFFTEHTPINPVVAAGNGESA